MSKEKGDATPPNGTLPSTGNNGNMTSNTTPVANVNSPTSNPSAQKTTQSGRKRKLTSPVWLEMTKEKIDNQEWAICEHCKLKLKATSGNGTSNLRNHLDTCPVKHKGNIVDALKRQKQIMVDKKANGTVQFNNWTFDPEHSRNALSKAIIMHEYPLSIVDHKGFRYFIQTLQPLFKMVCRNTIKKDIIKIYDIEREKLQTVLRCNTSRVAITTDMWTSNQKKGYMSITAHYIDEDWKLQSRILRFVYVPTPHTMDVLAEYLLEGLTSWHLETKISTITVDNCSTNDGMISSIKNTLGDHCLLGGRFLHMRCCAHILNLVVKDGLGVIEAAIEKIRDSVSFWSATPSRVEKFQEAARQANIPYVKKLALDCKTRWGSTYVMLGTALDYQDVFPLMKFREKLYKRVPEKDDWVKARSIFEKLEIFHDATKLFSGRKYPTTDVYFIKICEIRQALFEWMVSDDELIRKMAENMFQKFEKYWSGVHVVMAMGSVLDPRCKMKVVEYLFPSIYRDFAHTEIERVRKSCKDLVQEYQTRFVKPLVPDATSSCTSESQNGEKSSNSAGKLKKSVLEHLTNTLATGPLKSELDEYISDPTLPWTENFDILNWWKTSGTKYPTLQMIARDILAIPVSTVASESAFSNGGRVVSLYRSRLHENTLEALMCTQSWLWAQEEEEKDTIESSSITFAESENGV